MNRDRAILWGTLALVVLELLFVSVQVVGLSAWVLGGWSVIFMWVMVRCRLTKRYSQEGLVVFLRGTWGSALLLWVARPLLQVWAPYVLELGGGAFSGFTIVFACVAGLGTLFYILVLPMFVSSLDDLWKWMPVFDLSPKKGKTVEELKGGIDLPPRDMLFGGADRELVEHWHKVGHRMLEASIQRRRLFVTGVVVLAVWPIFIHFVSGGSQGAFERDVVRMWAVEPRMGGNGRDVSEERLLDEARDFFYKQLLRAGVGGDVARAKVEEAVALRREIQSKKESAQGRVNTVVPTRAAMNAARRVFKDELAFRGLSRLDARRLLGVERKNDRYVLDKPEHSWQEEQLVLRMDNGVESVSLFAGYDDAGRIRITWSQDERGMIPDLRALITEKDEEGE